jgi:hypothetical protein
MSRGTCLISDSHPQCVKSYEPELASVRFGTSVDSRSGRYRVTADWTKSAPQVTRSVSEGGFSTRE